ARIPGRDLPCQLDLAALSADLDRVRIVEPGTVQRTRDVLANIVGVHRGLDLDLIGNADDADQSSESLRGGFLLELPIDFAVQRDPSLFDSDLDGVGGNGRVPGQTLDRRRGDVLVASFDVIGKLDLD